MLRRFSLIKELAMSETVIPGWPYAESPFHAGSRSIQQRLGIEEKMDRQGRKGVRAFMPEQHRSFFPLLPFLLVGSVDARGQPWASVLVGAPGFVSSPAATSLRVNAAPLFGDPLQDNLREGAVLGVLGIELPTRRRNRLNGTVSGLDEGGFTVEVAQSFGNCPMYIQSRSTYFEHNPATPQPRLVQRSQQLDEAAQKLIANADTFFIATAAQEPEQGEFHRKGIDVSHRGGKPGFVRIDDSQTLTFPDFIGNSHYRTLGNLLLESRAGLLFIDFASGDLLYVAVQGELIWEGAEVQAFVGAERLVRLRVREAIRIEGGLPLRFSELEYSPALERTGTWAAA
jgi:hypothetical protein